ncbi:MAG: outer membrane beta-barrel protein [Ginsengibacter sp.]
MKKIKKLAVMCVFICFAFSANAQQGALKLGLNYNYSFPMSGFKNDIISNNSPRGFMGELIYSFNNQLAGGLLFGFQDYYQKYPRAIYHLSNTQDISAVLSNSVQTTPVLLKAKYFLAPSSYIKPYVSIAAGANLIDFKQYYGEFGSAVTNVGFRAQGGLGVLIPFKKTSASGINIGASYDYAPYKKNGYKDLSSANIQAGVVFELR